MNDETTGSQEAEHDDTPRQKAAPTAEEGGEQTAAPSGGEQTRTPAESLGESGVVPFEEGVVEEIDLKVFPPEPNSADRVCVQLRRICAALGANAEAARFDLADFNDVERIECCLMEIVGALEQLDLARPA